MTDVSSKDILNKIIGGLTSEFDSLIETIDQIEDEKSMKDLTIAKITSLAINIESARDDRPVQQANVTTTVTALQEKIYALCQQSTRSDPND